MRQDWLIYFTNVLSYDADTLYSLSRYKKVELLFKEALAFSRNAFSLKCYAETLHLLGRYGEAESFFKKLWTLSLTIPLF